MLQLTLKQKKLIENIILYCLMLLSLLSITFPYIWIFMSSFKIEKDIFSMPPKWLSEFTLSNYGAMGEFGYLMSLLNSLIISGSSLIISLLIGTLAAYSFSRFRLRAKFAVLTFITFLQIIPRMSLVLPLYAIFTDLGLRDTYVAMIISYTALQTPLVVLIMKGFFDDVPSEIEEAALVDGASYRQVFTKIVLPLAKSGLVATSVICLMFSWNEFTFPLILSGPNTKVVTVAVAENIGQRYVMLGPLFAVAMVATLPVLIFALTIQKYLIRGLTLGAVKY